MMKKDIEDMTIAEYMAYEVEMKRQPWKHAQFYYPTNRDTNSLSHGRSTILEYEHHSNNSNINAYLPLLLPCFKPVQPPIKNMYEPLNENTDVVSEDESETVEQEISTDTNDDKAFAPNPQNEDEDLDEWLNAKMEKTHVWITILKTNTSYPSRRYGISMHALTKDHRRLKINTPYPEDSIRRDLDNSTNNVLIPLDSWTSGLLVYRLPLSDIGASVNIMPKSIFEHLKLANLKETIMVVEMADMTKKVPLGIVEYILVKIDKFLFPFDFVIIDMLGEPNETMILGRPFLATIHAQIDVFKREISLGIWEDRIKFDMDGGVSHSKIPVEKIYMASSILEEEYLNPLEIKNDVFSYESSACLLFEQHTQSYENEGIDTLDLVQELECSHKEDTAYPCLHSPKTTKETRSIRHCYRMDDQNITMEEYIRLKEEKAQNVPLMMGFHLKKTLSCEPTVSSLNDEIDFRISFDDSDDEDYTVYFDKNSFSYKIISTNDLKTDLENDNEKVNMPSLPSPEPTVSCFDDLDFFNDFENEFPAIVYNDAQTSKLDLLTEPILSPQHIDEFDLNDETSLSKYDEEEQYIFSFNDLFPFNIIHSNDLKSEKDNDNNEVDIIQSSRDMALPPHDQRHQYLRREVHRVHVFDFRGLPDLMAKGLSSRMLMEHRCSGSEFGEAVTDLDTPGALQFQLGGARRRLS
ncbi:Toll/interleukin-1 receptor domain-containing protein [Tanacetum coccineum]